VCVRISAAGRLQDAIAGPVNERLLQFVAKLQVHRGLRRQEAVVLSSGLGSVMVNDVVGSDALVLVVVRGIWPRGERLPVGMLAISGRASGAVGSILIIRVR
jgi:hypothetical protein